MIDEELYQQAADELNSDARRPHLWARACALASDDHDEARYLYTNLRVEELIAQRKASGTDAVAGNGSNSGSADSRPGDDQELALAPIDGPDTPIASSRTGVDAHDDGLIDDTAFDEPREDESDSAVSVRTRAELDIDEGSDLAFELEPAADPHDSTLDRTLDDSLDRALDDSLDRALEGAEESMLEGVSAFPSLADDELDGERDEQPFETTLIDEPRWLDEDAPEEQPIGAEHPAILGRADGNMPAGTAAARDAFTPDDTDDRGDAFAGATVPSHEPVAHEPTALATGPDANRSDAADMPDLPARPGDRFEPVGSSRHDPIAGGRQLDDVFASAPGMVQAHENEPVVALEGSGPIWALYEKQDGGLQAVKRGVSWAAMLFTLPWLLWRGMVGTALVYALLWVISLGGLLVTGLAWSDAGAAASPMLKAACAGFALIALLGLVVVPFLRANRWRENKWQRADMLMRGEVRAGSAAEARRRVLER